MILQNYFSQVIIKSALECLSATFNGANFDVLKRGSHFCTASKSYYDTNCRIEIDQK
jgi:hypothetical protein